MKNFLAVVLVFLQVSGPAWGVSLNFTGHLRTEAALYNKGNLGTGTQNPSKAFISSRALLYPNLIVDDHFSVKSQWSLLSSPAFTPDAQPLGAASGAPVGLSVGQGGFVFGDAGTRALVLNRAWMEWISDFGVVRAGRMPVSWGYGLIWDSGNNLWDDFQTTLDRLEYRLHFGHVIGALAYSKPRKTNVLGSEGDQDFYTVYLQYDNPEMDVEAGVLYERQVRSSGQAADYIAVGGAANPYRLPTGSTNPPLSDRLPYPMSNNVVDIFVKKSVGYFTFGGEAGWLTGSAFDFNGNNIEDSLNAFGLLVNATYEYHSIKAFTEVLYASGDSNLNADHLNGFVVLHRNRRPGLILGRELLGNYYGNHVGQGSYLAYGDANSFSGAFYVRPGLRVEWSQTWATGLEVIFAQKAATATGEEGHLGVEIDLAADHSLYKNFDLGLTFGFLIPGQGLRVSNPSGVFAVRTTAGVRF